MFSVIPGAGSGFQSSASLVPPKRYVDDEGEQEKDVSGRGTIYVTGVVSWRMTRGVGGGGVMRTSAVWPRIGNTDSSAQIVEAEMPVQFTTITFSRKPLSWLSFALRLASAVATILMNGVVAGNSATIVLAPKPLARVSRYLRYLSGLMTMDRNECPLLGPSRTMLEGERREKSCTCAEYQRRGEDKSFWSSSLEQLMLSSTRL